MDLSRMLQLKSHLSPFVSWTFSRTHLEEVIVFTSLVGAKQACVSLFNILRLSINVKKKAGCCWGTCLILLSKKCQRWSITRLRQRAACGLLCTKGMRPVRAKGREECGDVDTWGYNQELHPMKGMGEGGFDSFLSHAPSLPFLFLSISSPVGKTLLLKQSSGELKYM